MIEYILRGSALIFAFKVIGAASLFMVHLIIGRVYGAESLGVFSLVFSLLIFSLVGAKVGLDVYVVRILPEIYGDTDKIGGFLAKIIGIVFIGSVIVSGAFLLLIPLIDRYVFKSIDASIYLVWLALLIFPFAMFNVIPEIFRGLGDIKRYSFFRNIAQNLFILIFISLSILVMGNDVDPVWILFIVTFLVAILAGVELWRFLLRLGVTQYNKLKYNKAIIKYSYPMMLTSSMMVLMGYVDSFMLAYYLDEIHVGIYNACIKLSIVITLVLASINGYIAPAISKAYSAGRFDQIKELYWESVKIVIISVGPIVFAYYLFPAFFLGLFGEEFISAKITFLIVTTAFLISAIFGPVGYLMNMTDNQSYVMRIVLFSLITNVSLNMLLIPDYGLSGAAVALLVSQLGWNVLLFQRGRRLGLV